VPLTVGELSSTRPASIKVLQRYGIDFCCGGGASVEDACAKRGINASDLFAEVIAEETRVGTPATRWDREPIPAVIAHLLAHYHAPLREDLRRIEAMANRVVDVHGHRDDRLEALLEVVVALRADLEPHLDKEEAVLFPWILSGRGADATGPIAVMRHEHDEVAALLVRCRQLTDDFKVPAGACATWRALWLALSDLDRELREHIALENNVLFPRALPETT
jgi:regulator of cell morphogenesis and NO signaling